MKNITITMEEEVAHWAKIEAAKTNTSVSRMLGAVLKKQMNSERHYQQAQDRFFSRTARPLKKVDQPYPSRESVYDR